jgi:hypothetical protein
VRNHRAVDIDDGRRGGDAWRCRDVHRHDAGALITEVAADQSRLLGKPNRRQTDVERRRWQVRHDPVARPEQPSLPPLPEIVPILLVRAITELMAAEVRGGRTERLRELERDLVFVAVKLLADDETALRAVA